MGRKISKTERHIRWNWETIGENEVRYHFIVVDNKNRDVLMNKIIEQIREFGFIEHIRKCEGKVRNSRFRYLFNSYDSNVSPTHLDLTKLKKPLKKDYDLKERKKGNIEDYVYSIYER